MGVRNIIIVGSVGAGKTTLAKILPKVLERFGYRSQSIDLCVFHGLSYLILAFVTKILINILDYKYLSNYYLTLWFNNRNLFLKLYRLLLLLDVFSLLPISLFRIYTRRLINDIFRRKYIIVIDEHYLTGLAVHFYFSRYAGISKLHQVYYAIVFSQIKKMNENGLLVVFLKTSLRNSIIMWFKREMIKVIDVNMIRFRDIFTKIFIEKIIKPTLNPKTLKITIKNVSEISRCIPIILRAILCG